MSPHDWQVAVLAWIAAAMAIIPAFVGLLLLILRNARDIQAAWDQLRAHGRQLNGKGRDGE